MKPKKLVFLMLGLFSFSAFAQNKGLVNTSQSQYAKLYSPDISDVHWTGGHIPPFFIIVFTRQSRAKA